MRYQIVPLADEHADASALLFVDAYNRERLSSPLLPPEPMGSAAALRAQLAQDGGGPAVAAFRGRTLVGYMRTTAQFDWKGQRVSLSREHSHAAAPEDLRMVYQLMYAALAERWVDSGSYLHILCHFAGDPVLHDTIFRLGFGAFLAENLRDLSPLTQSADVEVAECRDPEALREIAREHGRYYRQSPIFVLKGEEDAQALKGLDEPGGTILVYRESGEPAAYLAVGPCAGKGDGVLLRDTNTAQVRSAYARESIRGRGVGAALLAHAVVWAGRKGFERLYVEHETANIAGGSFWRRHFSPYLYASMRYVDTTIR